MSHYLQSDAPQVVHNNRPEVLYTHEDTNQKESLHAQTIPSPELAKNSNIFGPQRPTFWLLVILVAVVIIAAVGGGIGGSLAVQKAK